MLSTKFDYHRWSAIQRNLTKQNDLLQKVLWQLTKSGNKPHKLESIGIVSYSFTSFIKGYSNRPAEIPNDEIKKKPLFKYQIRELYSNVDFFFLVEGGSRFSFFVFLSKYAELINK